MIITSSNVNMASARTYKRKEAAYATYSKTVTNTEASITEDDFKKLFGTKQEEAASADSNSKADETTDTSSSLELFKERLAGGPSAVKNKLLSNQIDQMQRIRRQMIDYLMKVLFGKDYTKPEEMDNLEEDVPTPQNNNMAENTYQLGVATSSFTYFYEYSESEEVSFSTTGTVMTEDGREIDFGLSMTLSRSFVEQTESIVDYSQPILIDPLVIHVDSSFTGISDQSFYFDLDADGEMDEINSLKSGSGFLALDKNDNGIIDDGNELFGTQTGNGFAELSKYDSDKNGWIDEADEIFSKLKVWYKDDEGNDKLVDLKEAGVGAIYLGSSSADFSLTNEQNATNAVVRRHGIFLYEDGNVGSIQQIDMAKRSEYSA